MNSKQKLWAGVLALIVVAALAGPAGPGGALAPVRADLRADGLVVNEIDYDQPTTDTAEFIEIRNNGGGSVNLDAYRLDLVNGTTWMIYRTIDLPNVDLAAGDYFVVCGSMATVANCDLDATPDTDLIQNGTPDAVALMLDTTLIDTVSYEGNTAPPYTEGSGEGLEDDPALADHSISRCPDGSDSDYNSADFVYRTSTPGAANDCEGVPGDLVVNEIDYDQPETDEAEFIEIRNNGSSSVNLDTYRLDLVNANQMTVYRSIDLPDFDLAAGGYFVVCGNTATVANCDLDATPDADLVQNGAPDAVALMLDDTLVDTVSYEGDTGAPYTEGSGEGLEDDGYVAGWGISRCPDGVDSQQNNVDLRFRPVTPGAANDCGGLCGDPATLIHDVQGSGLTSPMNGATGVEIEGVVVGDFQDTAAELGGFFLQEEDGDADGDAATSEGIFVYDNGFGVDVGVGSVVRVMGDVAESYGLTRLENVALVQVCDGEGVATPAVVDLPVGAVEDLEAFEGMSVLFPEMLYATETYNLGRFGEVWVSANDRLYTPTQVAAPGAPALAVQALNDRSRILIDDGSNVENPATVPYLAGDHTLRLGDTVAGLSGALSFAYSSYRVQPTVAPVFVRANERTAGPDDLGDPLTVATLNVLNFFNGDGAGGGFPTARGATTYEEYVRQRTKLVAAIVALDADAIGLQEIENDGYGPLSAIQDLVNGLNDATAPGSYAFVDPGVAQIGTDAIAVGLIYRPARVSPVGGAAILDSTVDPIFLDTKNRPSLAQTFHHPASGQTLTLAVNHLKSKGSDCDDVGDPDTGDGQGECNLTRTDALIALANWLATDPTGSGDPDFLVIGDMNSYALEDPITTLESMGYTDLVELFVGLNAYSYVFDGQAGTMDHALANGSLLPKVAAATIWHSNADEPRCLDYNDDVQSSGEGSGEINPAYLYSPDAYRASDHDAVVVQLKGKMRVYLPLVQRGYPLADLFVE